MDLYWLIRLLRRVHLYAPLYALKTRATQALTRRGAQNATFANGEGNFNRVVEGLSALAGRAERRLLAVGWPTLNSAALQIPIIAAFIRAGFRPTVLLDSPAETRVQRLYQAAGALEFAYWTHLQPSRRKLAAVPPSQGEMLASEDDGIRIGRYALSTMMRNTRRARFDFSDSKDRASARIWLQKGLDAVAYAEQLIDRWRPDALLLNDQGYLPAGPLFERCLRANIPVFTWNAAHRDSLIMLKRYGVHNIDVHPSSLSKESWDSVRRRPWDDAEWEILRRELVDSYKSGQWFGEVGTQFNKIFPERTALLRQLSLNPDRRTVLIFPHIFWDGTFFWGKDLFSDYEEFFTETLKIAYETPAANWIVKIHPANVVKAKRDGMSQRSSEWDVIDSLGPPPAHVRVLDATTDISTLSLFEIGDVCVTVRGTVGLEAACFGLPTLTAGTGRYDRLGFTIDPATPEEFRNLLRHVNRLPKPTVESIEGARRYLHGILLERPVRYRTVKFGFSQDALASLMIDIDRNAEPLLDAEEVRQMENFIRSGADDFVASAH